MNRKIDMTAQTTPWISQISLLTWTPYAHAAKALLTIGNLSPDDPRLSPAVADAIARVDFDEENFFKVASAVEERARIAIGAVQGNSPLGTISARQRKLVTAARRSGDVEGLEADAMAIGFEQLGHAMLIEGVPHSTVVPLFTLAARGTDRSVLSRRARRFDGLSSSIAIDSGITMAQASIGLYRVGLLDETDPRLMIDQGAVEMCNGYSTGAFLDHVKKTVWRRIPDLAPDVRGPFSTDRLREAAAKMPRWDLDMTGIAADWRDGDFMNVAAQIAEIVAMNLRSQGKADVEEVGRLLACAYSARARAQAYHRGNRAHDQTGATPSPAAMLAN